jgi:hypothetical protein
MSINEEKEKDDLWNRQEDELKKQEEAYNKVKHEYENNVGRWIAFAAEKCVGVFEDRKTASIEGQRAARNSNRVAALILQIGMEEEDYYNLSDVF